MHGAWYRRLTVRGMVVALVLAFEWYWSQYVVFAHWMLCCPVGYVERGGALPAVTGLTVQRIICC